VPFLVVSLVFFLIWSAQVQKGKKIEKKLGVDLFKGFFGK